MRYAIRPVYLLLTSMTVSAVLLLMSAGKAVEREKALAAARQAVHKEEAPVGFIVKEADGRLALFRENTDRPYKILATEVWLLPEEDRLALAEGIYVADEAALRTMLEDWDSEE